MKRACLVTIVLLLRGIAPADAVPESSPVASSCDAAEAADLRTHLTAQQQKADRWNLAWRITFTAAAVGTLAVGVANPFPSLQTGLYASSGKATIGALARWFLPLRIHVPAETSDTCADVSALRTELRRVARKQRSLFWLGHVGGILVNLGGAAYVWYEDSASKALLSIAVGYPVGLLSNYTMPRGAWHKYRDATWTSPTVTAAPHKDGWVVTLSGAF